jgi:uncharacterized protein (TIGR03000 family)
MFRPSRCALGSIVVVIGTLSGGARPLLAWELGGPLYQRGLPDSPPASWFGYNLDDTNPGYYGGGRYREYYNFGRGYGLANYPGPLPPYPAGGPRRWYGDPFAANAMPALVPDGMIVETGVAYLNLDVPEDADVWMEGVKTKQSGRERRFVSPPLLAGYNYALAIRICWNEGGQSFEKSKEVLLRAGDRVRVRLQLPAQPELLPLPKPAEKEATDPAAGPDVDQ